MALIFADPCGCFYSTTAQALSGLYTTLSASIATSGLPSGNIEPTALKNVTNLVIPVPNSAGPYYFGFRFIPNGTIGAGQNLLAFLDASGNPQVTTQTNLNGTLTVKRGSGNGTTLGTSSTSTTMTDGVWSFLEFALVCDPSAGNFQIQINGSNVLSLTNVNTQGSNSTTIGAVQILGASVNNYVQDIYICDSTGTRNNTFLGDVEMPASLANANGTYAAWSANGASPLYACVNAATPADGSIFASDSTPGDRMSVAYPSTTVAGTIVGIAHVSRMLKSTSGTRTVSQVVTSNGVDDVGPAQALSTSYTYYEQISETDPNTGQPWTAAGFNQIQTGLITES